MINAFLVSALLGRLHACFSLYRSNVHIYFLSKLQGLKQDITCIVIVIAIVMNPTSPQLLAVA